MTPKSKLFTALTITGALAAGCASTPPANSELQLAEIAYQSASANPTVAQVAPNELRQASQSLQQAESAWKEGQDPTEVTHLAYLAKQRAALASSIGQQHELQQRFEQVANERSQIQLQARTREAEVAQANARQAEQQARLAQQQSTAAEQQRQQLQQQVAATRQRNEELQQQLQGLQARQSDRGLVVTLSDVVFATGKAQLSEGGLLQVDRIADFLGSHSDRKVLVEGFTDSTGSPALNLSLSQQRAEAVKTELIARGVSPDRVLTRGFGDAYPVAPNGTPAGRQLNRRVEVVFSDEQGSLPSR